MQVKPREAIRWTACVPSPSTLPIRCEYAKMSNTNTKERFQAVHMPTISNSEMGFVGGLLTMRVLLLLCSEGVLWLSICLSVCLYVYYFVLMTSNYLGSIGITRGNYLAGTWAQPGKDIEISVGMSRHFHTTCSQIHKTDTSPAPTEAYRTKKKGISLQQQSLITSFSDSFQAKAL